MMHYNGNGKNNSAVSPALQELNNRAMRILDNIERNSQPLKDSKEEMKKNSTSLEEVEAVIEDSYRTIDRITRSYSNGFFGKLLVKMGLVKPGSRIEQDIETVRTAYEKMDPLIEKQEALWTSVNEQCNLNGRKIADLDELVGTLSESIQLLDGEMDELKEGFNDSEDLGKKAELEAQVSLKKHIGEDYNSLRRGAQQELVVLDSSTEYLKSYRDCVQCYLNIAKEERSYGKAIHSQLILHKDAILDGTAVVSAMKKLADSVERSKKDVGQLVAANMKQAAALTGYSYEKKDYHVMDEDSRKSVDKDTQEFHSNVQAYSSDLAGRATAFLEHYKRRRI